MHQVPQPKEQARLLKAYLATLGLNLAHQPSLEAIAKVMGYKNWKTMSAQAGTPEKTGTPSKPTGPTKEAPTEDVQPETPGPTKGTLYRVPVTVDVTMTAYIEARGESKSEAIAIARNYATEVYPRLFSMDEGNHRGVSDFYCPDEAAVDCPPDIQDLDEDDFDGDTAEVRNNMGMQGEFSVKSTDGQYLFEAELASNAPDNSDDELRSQCTLYVKLSYAKGHEKEGAVILKRTHEYVYDGDDRSRGDHLEELFHENDLMRYLVNAGD